MPSTSTGLGDQDCGSDLMDDHQSELAESMENRGHLLQAASPAQLVEKFKV